MCCVLEVFTPRPLALKFENNQDQHFEGNTEESFVHDSLSEGNVSYADDFGADYGVYADKQPKPPKKEPQQLKDTTKFYKKKIDQERSGSKISTSACSENTAL